MPRTTKTSHEREHEDEERTDVGAPEVNEIDPEERTASSKIGDADDEEERAVDDDEDLADDIDLDDLAAMEGPDA